MGGAEIRYQPDSVGFEVRDIPTGPKHGGEPRGNNWTRIAISLSFRAEKLISLSTSLPCSLSAGITFSVRRNPHPFVITGFRIPPFFPMAGHLTITHWRGRRRRRRGVHRTGGGHTAQGSSQSPSEAKPGEKVPIASATSVSATFASGIGYYQHPNKNRAQND